jgi:hypothetical protein
MSATENEDLLKRWRHLPDFDTTFVNEDGLQSRHHPTSEPSNLTVAKILRPLKELSMRPMFLRKELSQPTTTGDQ